MSYTEWKSRERNRIWKERLEIAAGSFVFGLAIMAVLMVCLQLDMLVVLP